MGARKKQKYTAGEAANYVTRKQAMRKLQLNLKDFRRLCILKGIHPREPRNRKRAQKGDMTNIKILFHEKDIRFLLHEPVVWKFREFKVFLKKLKKAKDKAEYKKLEHLNANKPKYLLDHIVKERYPTFIDAIRDLEDCLCLCFLYATFPRNSTAPVEMISLCRKLTIEFMHYIIESKSLRKVFVSIKGYYYQAEIMGQIVTWIVPHQFSYDKPENVDIKLMSIFVEFYTTMLGFVNFRLYHNLNLIYPPKLQGMPADIIGDDNEKNSELVAALNKTLVKTVVNMDNEDEMQIDEIPTTDDKEKLEEAKKEADEIKNLLTLFKESRVFISREVPREPLVFMIRSFGGEVSWDSTTAEGSTFDIKDSKITHQICDRPKEAVDMADVKRYYIQPQWIFDSINRRQLLPVDEYFVGKVLPAHLSPFISERRIGDYMPPEEKKLLGIEDESNEGGYTFRADREQLNKDDEEDEEEDDDEEEEEEEDDDEEEEKDEDEEEEDEEDNEEEEEEKEIDDAKAKMSVSVGKTDKVDNNMLKQLEKEEYRLREKMIPKKHAGLYRSMKKSEKRRAHESRNLTWKRKQIDLASKKQAKTNKAK